MKRIGIDIGAYSCKVAVLNETDQIAFLKSIPHRNKVQETLLAILDEIHEDAAAIGLCGSLSGRISPPAQWIQNDALALSAAVSRFAPQARSIIELGAQKTCYIVPDSAKGPQIYRNSNCSAGTGSFFEEQAGRLQIPLEQISDVIADATDIPNIAGRCSVFSKTDMIHKMQEGVSTANILNGLCYALVRNYKSSILKNRPVATPVLLCGGLMKNQGVRNALKDLLKLRPEDYILDDPFEYYPALGCALEAGATATLAELRDRIRQKHNAIVTSSLPPLKDFLKKDDFSVFQACGFLPGDAYLGIDVGSTSINLVLLSPDDRVEYFSYVRTLGKPIEVVTTELERLKALLPAETHIASIAVTGSGRERIASAIGADLAINEITAQTAGAVLFHTETDTVFEIGGQDSKYMAVENQKMKDFEMNKVCAAGTGAFLEEQIAKLGISMAEFMDYALRSQTPCELGSRCTVFIESSITKALADGRSMEDICAGLAYAIVSNYLYRVVNQKPIGQHIALQGGIAYNQAVVCAFRALTGQDVYRSPYFSVTGALGAARLCRNRDYLRFDQKLNRQRNRELTESSEASYLRDYTAPVQGSGRKVIGIPRVIFLHKMFPLFRTMLTSLGFDVLLSPLSDASIVALAQQYTVEETCYPIKLIHGHIAWLLNQGVDYILLPRLYTIKHEGSVARKDYACMYMQVSPLLMEKAFHFQERGVKLLMPELSLNFGKKFMIRSILSLAPMLGKKKIQMIPAALKGVKSVVSHTARLEELGRRSIDDKEPTFVLVSRVYNIIDPVLSMGIEEHLNRMGCRVVHLEHLEASHMHVENDYPDLYWPFGQHILTGLKLIKKHPNLYPIYITNHGCGPDTAIQHFLKQELHGREYLHLEVDEHASKIGILTRLEAFLYSLAPQTPAPAAPQPEALTPTKVLIPDFGIYSDLIEQTLTTELPIVRVQPLQSHKTFNYAINKEYHSLLVMMEEILNTATKDEVYEMVFPIDEGSEVFGQYALLVYQELIRRGYRVVLRKFYLEDIIRREDYESLFLKLMACDMASLTERITSNVSSARALGVSSDISSDAATDTFSDASADVSSDPAHIHTMEDLSALAHQVQPMLTEKKQVLLLGEPLCVYKDYICQSNTAGLQDHVRLLRMPLSEALLFHMKDIDRTGAYASRIAVWERCHQAITEQFSQTDWFTPMDQLFDKTRGQLDFLVGDFGKYRFAKLQSLSKQRTGAAIQLHSSEENTAIILKTLQNPATVEVPVVSVDVDYEHSLTQEQVSLLLHQLNLSQ